MTPMTPTTPPAIPSDIPATIREAASELASQIAFGSDPDCIARALLAAQERGKLMERERCAGIADDFVGSVDADFAQKRPNEAANFERDNETARAIAAAIREAN